MDFLYASRIGSMENPHKINMLWEKNGFFLDDRLMVFNDFFQAWHKHSAQGEIIRPVLRLSLYDLDESPICSLKNK